MGDLWFFFESKSACNAAQDKFYGSYGNDNSYETNHTFPTLEPFPTYAFPTYEPYPTYSSESPDGSTSEPAYTKSECQSDVNEEYAGTMRSYGCSYPCPDSGTCGSKSVCDAMWHEAQKAMGACEQYE